MSVKIEIKSRPGTFITLDKEVAEKIGHWAWCVNNRGYVSAHVPGSGSWKTTGRVVHLAHAVIWAVTGKWIEKGQEVDHINHDKKDNKYENLRIVTRTVNNRNMLRREGTCSKYLGVAQSHKNLSWRAQVGITKAGKTYWVTSSATKDEVLAAKCTDCIRDLIGGFLPRNFPELTFQEKWKSIGEKQRRQIFHSMARNNIPIHDNTLFYNWNFAA